METVIRHYFTNNTDNTALGLWSQIVFKLLDLVSSKQHRLQFLIFSDPNYFFYLWNYLPSSYHFRFIKDISKSVLQKMVGNPEFYPFLTWMEKMAYVPAF